jgi:hypothetical protein
MATMERRSIRPREGEREYGREWNKGGRERKCYREVGGGGQLVQSVT